MPKSFSTAVVLLSVLAGLFALGRLRAATITYSDGSTVSNSRAILGEPLTLSILAGRVATETGVFNGPGDLIKTGEGHLTLTGLHTYAGDTTISAGILTLAGTTRSPSFAISSGASLNFLVASGTRDGSAATTTFTGAGTLIKSGAGNLIWGANSAVFAFSAGAKISVEAGTFVGGSNANENWTANYADLEVASGAIFLGAEANVRVNALTGAGRITSGYDGAGYQNFTFGVGNGSGTFSGILANDDGGFTGHYVKTGMGTQLLTGDNTYTGTTTINGGTLALSGATSSSAFVLGAGSVLDYRVVSGPRDAAAATTMFTGTGTLLKSGAGTLGWVANSAVFALSSGAKINVQGGTFAAGGFANENWTNNQADLEVATGALFIGAEANVRVNALTGAGRITSGYDGAGYQNFTFGVSNGSGTFAGVLANDDAAFTGHYVKTGTGTQILTGANTYTGTTTISGGTLQIGDGGSTGSLASSAITNNAALVFNRSGTSNYAGDIGGTGTLTKLGDGTLTLSGTNTYTGNTTISDGTLALASASDQTLSGILSGAGSLAKAGAGTLTLSGDNPGYTGATTISAGTLVLGTSTALGTTGAIAIASGATLDSSAYGANLARFSGAGTLTSSSPFTYNSAADHSLDLILAGAALLDKEGAGTLTLSGNHTYTGRTNITGGTLNVTGTLGSGDYAGNIANANDLIFASASNQTLSGVLSGSGMLNKSGAGTLTLAGANTYTGNTTISAGTLAISGTPGSGNIANAGALAFTSDSHQTLSGILSGAGSLTKSGAGTLTLSGGNTYTGDTTIATGTLVVSGTLGFGNYAGNIANAGALTFSATANQTLSGILAGSGSLTQAGSGTLTLSGNNTGYTGTTMISSGTLLLGQATALGTTGTIAIATGATLDASTHAANLARISGAGTLTGSNSFTYNSANNLSLATRLAGSATLTKAGTGTLTLSGDNTYGGGTTITAGTVTFSDAANFGLGSITLNGGILQWAQNSTTDISARLAGLINATFDPNGNDVTFASTLSGTGSLTKAGTGTLTLSGANTYTGVTTITRGTLSVNLLANGGLASSIGKSSSDASNLIIDNGTLAYTGNADHSTDRRFQLGSIDSISAGTLANYGTGSIAFTNTGNLTYGTTNWARDFILDGTNTGANDLAASITNNGYYGNVSVTKYGSGSWTLSGANTYTGPTSVYGGTLIISGSLGAGRNYASTIGIQDATLIFASSLDQLVSGGISSTGNLTQAGTGTLTLSGYNSYFGDTTVSSGTLRLAHAYALGNTRGVSIASGATLDTSTYGATLAQISGSGTLTGSGVFTYNSANNAADNLLIAGSASLAKFGSSTLTLSAANSYSGGTTIYDGLINFSTLANLGTGTITLNGGGLQWATGNTADVSSRLAPFGSAGATFDTNGNNVSFASAISGSGALTKSGAGTLTLASATYTGPTSVYGGTLIISGTLSSGNYAGYIENYDTLVFASNSNQSLSGQIFGTGSLTKSGAGTLTLSGTNTYGGGTTLNAGTLEFSDATNFGTGSIALNGGILQWVENTAADLSAHLDALVAATFDLNGNEVTFGSALSGTGSLTKIGTGTLTLAGANTYTGTLAISDGTLDVAGTLGSGSYAAAIANAGTLKFSGSSGQTLSGIISGSGNLTKSGAGILTLSGANTYSGGTAVSGGVVNFSSLANFGTGSVSLNGGGLQWAPGTSTDASAQLAALGTNGATFDTNGNDVTFASALSGSGALTKTGAGTLTLSGVNTHSGGTTVAGGLVNFSSLGNFGTGSVTLNGGGLQWGLYNYTDVSSRLAPFGPNGATFDTNGKDISFASALSGSGGLTKSGDGRLRLSAANSYTGTTTINGGSILLVGTATLGSGATILNGTGSLYLSGTTANAGNGNFTLNGDAPDIGTGTRITFAAANVSGNFTVNGGTIDTAGSGTLEFLTGTAGTATITNNAAMGSGYGGRTLFSGSSRAADSTITNNGSTVAGAQAGGTEFHGTAIAERATLIANGGSNGGAGGFISFSANSNGSASTVKVYGNGTLDISLHDPGFVSVGSLEGTGQVNLGSNNLYVGYQNGNIINNVSTVFSGIIQGAGGSLTKFGTGTFTLSGENTYSGGTTIYGGMVNFARLANFGTGTVTVMSGGLQWAPGNTSDISSRLSAIGSGGATFDTNGNNVTFASGVSGSGRVTKAGTGTLTLSGNNTYTGGTTITGGIVNFSSLGSGTVTLNGGGLQWASGSSTAITVSLGAGGGTFDTNGNDVTLTGSLSGSGGITKSGAGTLTFSADGRYSYTGNTTINSGTLRFDGPLGFYAGNIANAGTLVVNHPSGGFILSGVISGSGNLVSSAYLTLAGVNTYTGNTASSVSLTVTGTLGAGNYAGDIAVSRSLSFNSSADQLLSGVISGPAQLNKNGSGTLTLTGANVYSGLTFIDAGTLALSGGDNRLPTGQFVTISNGATLDLGGYSQELNLPSVTTTSLRVTSGTVTAGTIKSNATVSIAAGTLANTWEGTGLLRIGGDANATVYLNGTNNSERVGTTSQLYIGDASTAGIVKIGNANALLAASQDALIYRGTLDLNGQTEVRGHGLIFMNGSTASLINGSTDHAASFLNSVALTTGLANIGGAGQLTLGPISGNGGFTKIGTGTLTLSADNTYSGGTTINAGTLAAGSAAAFGSSTVRVDAGTLDLGGFAVTNALDVRGGTLIGLANYAGTQTVSAAMNYAGTVGGSMVVASGGTLNTTGATFTGATSVLSGGRLSGTGSLAALTLNSGATLAPGNSPGTLTVTDNATWNGGANYVWEINHATGVAGANYDLVSISGSLTLAATSENKFTLSLLSLLTSNAAGNVINFDAAQNYSYMIASATGGIFGFDANAFTINTNGFTNATNGGSWNLSQVGNTLNLNFAAASAIPEPSTYAALFGALVLGLAIYRKRSRR